MTKYGKKKLFVCLVIFQGLGADDDTLNLVKAVPVAAQSIASVDQQRQAHQDAIVAMINKAEQLPEINHRDQVFSKIKAVCIVILARCKRLVDWLMLQLA